MSCEGVAEKLGRRGSAQRRPYLMRVQWRWPIGMPLCRAMGGGLWEVRANCRVTHRASVFLLTQAQLVALHGFIKKTRATPDEDLKLARKRKEDIEW